MPKALLGVLGACALMACGTSGAGDTGAGAAEDAGISDDARVDGAPAAPDASLDAPHEDAGASRDADADADAADGGAAMRVEAWIFPGDPACNAPAEYGDGRVIDVLKPEYFRVNANGALDRLDVAAEGCNAYSVANAADVKAHSKQQLVTVSAGAAELGALAGDATKRATAITTLIAFVEGAGFSGVDIDFEGSWNATEYAGYLTFLEELGAALHAKGHLLEIDTTAFADAAAQATQRFRYEDVAPLPIDGIVVMAYDYMTDYGPGAGAPIAPNTWVSNVIDWAVAKVGNASRVVIGIPSYGYSGKTGSTDVNRAPYATFTGLPGFATATTLPDAFEKGWTTGGTSYVYVDRAGLDAKRALIASKGIRAISVWHLGGNEWFTK